VIEILDYLHTSLATEVFGEVTTYGATIGFIIGTIQLIYVMARVFTFAYYFYIDHGFILADADSNRDKIETTLKKLGKKESKFAKGYFQAFIFSLLMLGLWTIILNFWYVTLPIFGTVFLIASPVIIIKFLAREKRNRVVFEQKLEGTYPDESV